MPLPKEPSKLAATLSEIPPITTPRVKKPAAKSASPEVGSKQVKPPLTLATSNHIEAKAPQARQDALTSDKKAAPHRSRQANATPVSKAKRQVKDAGKKIFVLDTNVLMHDPMSLFRFEEHDVFLPLITLEELDNHKKGMSEVARHARQVSRSLDALMENIEDIERAWP